MRILVYEFASGGGFAGRDVPASLGREGSAMRAALARDLVALGAHVMTTADERFPLAPIHGVDVVIMPAAGARRRGALDRLISLADAVWVIAPETDGCLEELVARVEEKRKVVLGPGAAAIRRAADKAALPRLLSRHGIDHPETRVFSRLDDWCAIEAAAEELGYPVVAKPARGAGSEGVALARTASGLRRAVDALRATVRERLVLQRYVRGTPASVSLLADGRHAIALTTNAQLMTRAFSGPFSCSFSYGGGVTPFEHPMASAAARVAVRTVESIHGLRGYIGVDVVLTRRKPVVIEVNPRLTTAYLGVRATVDENVAGLAIAACKGRLPDPPAIQRSVGFSSAGRIRRR